MDNKNKNVKPFQEPTNFQDLRRYASGSLIELPPFGPEQPFFARVKRPSMLAMVNEGKIPNTLLRTAESLFSGDEEAVKSLISGDGEGLKQILSMCELMAKASLVSPTYNEIINAGLKLTDDQLIFLFNYSQQGVEALKRFHTK